MPILYHNPKCTKSRQAVSLLQEMGSDIVIKDYIQDGFTPSELLEIFSKFNSPISHIIRSKEAKEYDLTDDYSMEEWAQHIMTYPRILQRPLLVTDTEVIVGRPTETLRPYL